MTAPHNDAPRVNDGLRFYRAWFRAAAIYNAVWGIAVVLFPVPLSRLVGLELTASAVALAQCIGMMVGVFAIGYWLMARDPTRYAGFIWIALAGKTLGPIGLVYSALVGALPWTVGWACLFNDLIWWPVFWSFALRHGMGAVRRAE